jgi:hypothetical protein
LGVYLTENFCLFVKRIHLRLHKLGLNFDDFLAEFLHERKSSGNVLDRIAQKYSIEILPVKEPLSVMAAS